MGVAESCMEIGAKRPQPRASAWRARLGRAARRPCGRSSIFGLLLGTRHLALAGASAEVLRPARRLLIFASVVTLALNVADPLVAGEFGNAAFDAVGPLLLIGWAEVGPGFLQAISESNLYAGDRVPLSTGQADSTVRLSTDGADEPVQSQVAAANRVSQSRRKAPQRRTPELLLEQARQEDAVHRVAHQKPISADTLRVRLGIGAAPARRMVKAIRAEYQPQIAHDPGKTDGTSGAQVTPASLVA
jgi:hypothetical protein